MIRVERVPDTLFLPERARLALNCLTQRLNPEKEWLPYCVVDLTGSPPRMRHSQFDFSDHTARVIDAILLAQAMTGSTDGEAALAQLERSFWAGFGSAGPHELRVNLLINHIGPDATVQSWLPQQGRIQVAPRRELDVLVRAPSWADRRQLKTTVDGREAAFSAAEAHFIAFQPFRPARLWSSAFPCARPRSARRCSTRSTRSPGGATPSRASHPQARERRCIDPGVRGRAESSSNGARPIWNSVSSPCGAGPSAR